MSPRNPIETDDVASGVARQRRHDQAKLEQVVRLPGPPPVPRTVTLPAQAPETPIPEASRAPGEVAAAALRRQAELEQELVAERAARAAAEQREKVLSQRPPADALSDDAVGKMVKAVVSALTKRVGGPLALLAMLLGGGGFYSYAYSKPTPPPLTAEQLNDRIGKFEEKVVGRLDSHTVAINGVVDLQRCQRRKTNQIGESLLPAPDKMGPARRQSAFEDDCGDGPKRLPEPRQ